MTFLAERSPLGAGPSPYRPRFPSSGWRRMNRTLAVAITPLAVNRLLAGMPNPAGADGRQDHRVDGGRGCKGAEMTNPPDVGQTLEHCMRNITGASAAMADDMHGAAMMLGAAEMMLA